MPNIWTHIMFCEDVMVSLNDPVHLQDAQGFLNLGAQGPDPFFYHNFWPWKQDEHINDIGKRLHTEKCGPFLMDMIQSGIVKSKPTKAYILGFVTHHILDRNAHPYIHYRAGYQKNKHQELEVLIDTLMMKKFRNLDTWKVPVYKEIDVGSTLDHEISELLSTTILHHFHEHAQKLPEDFVQLSYRDMKRALKILFDPYSWKNHLLGSMISPFSHQPIKNDKDYLNENHSTWHHPATNEPHHESFIDLYNQGKKESLETLYAIIKYWEDPNSHNEQIITDLIDNISYDTGKPLAENLENRYSSPIV
ncbi:Zinc dependent phospholipase C [Salinibacillus kushneri]|uniref:Zinc dependent phospholipase C n=1 Tax=Salinibacillus kushneri TaxID=237682 RepID=A0A1I0AUR4_9BACI|nr:zinc dependent phospholipase C family protein [Salinibacillus kushneri]SES98099.1 Zinc dependent phospholipase C [Salinibacillus kushneri]